MANSIAPLKQRKIKITETECAAGTDRTAGWIDSTRKSSSCQTCLSAAAGHLRKTSAAEHGPGTLCRLDCGGGPRRFPMNGVRPAARFVRTNLWIVPLALLLAWARSRLLDPAPPRHLVMVTGRGSAEVQLGLIQSGTTRLLESSQLAGLESLGAIYHEPLWLFQRRGTGISRLTDLFEHRVSVGAEGGGTWAVVSSLISQLGEHAGEQALATGEGQQRAAGASLKALQAGELDAAFFVLPVHNSTISRLLVDPEMELVSLEQTAALAARLSFLER